jgi:nicotinate-nucleotide pyrophosphorylase (carboxylating)
MTPFPNPFAIDRLIESALDEDLGRAGDITTRVCVPESATARATIGAREAGTVAGLDIAAAVFQKLDPSVEITLLCRDGDRVVPGAVLATIEGRAWSVLSAERVALNLLGHLCGIATATADYADRIKHTRARVTCTRKTTPGLRALEKYAVRCGGGANHRFGLDDAVLIKDNHVAVAGGIVPALRAAKAAVGHLVKIEIEVDSLAQLDEVLAEGADAVLLDNMDVTTLAEAVRRIGGRMTAEASGGVRLDTIAAVAETGVDLVSVGRLTHSVKSLDVGLDIAVH